jgi:hypothetical protein
MAGEDLRFDVQISCSAKESLHFTEELLRAWLRASHVLVGLFWREPQKSLLDQGSSAPRLRSALFAT